MNCAGGTFSSLTNSVPVKPFEQVLEIHMLPLAATEIGEGMCVTFMKCRHLRDSRPSICKSDRCETFPLSIFHQKDAVMSSTCDDTCSSTSNGW